MGIGEMEKTLHVPRVLSKASLRWRTGREVEEMRESSIWNGKGRDGG